MPTSARFKTLTRFKTLAENDAVLLALFLVAIQLLAYRQFRIRDEWNLHFFDEGLGGLFYSLDRVILLCNATLMIFCAGALLLPSVQFLGFTATSRMTHRFFVGAALLSLIGIVFSRFGILKPAVIFAVTLPLLAVAPIVFNWRFAALLKKIKGWGSNKLEVLAWATLSFQAVCLLLCRGLVPDLFYIDSLGHYIPYYEEIFRAGKLVWPTPFYVDYFFLKGSGLTILFGAISDANTSGLISFQFFMASGLLVFSWLESFFGRQARLVTIGLLVVYFASPLFAKAEFQKTHVISSVIFLYLFFATVQLTCIQAPKRLFLALLFVAILFVIMNPAFTVFVFLALGLQFVFGVLQRDWSSLRVTVSVALTMALTLVGLLATNYATTGVVELTPFSQVLRMSDPARRPESLLLLHTRYIMFEEGHSSGGFLKQGVAESFIGFWNYLIDGFSAPENLALKDFIFKFLIACAFYIFAVRKMRDSKSSVTILKVAGSFFVAVYIMKGLVTQGSFERGIEFLPAIRILVLSSLLISLMHGVKILSLWLKIDLLSLVYLLLFCGGVIFAGSLMLEMRQEKFLASSRLAFGQQSLAEFYGFKRDDPCTAARGYVGAGPRITLMHFIPACVGKPTDHLDYIDPIGFLDGNNLILLEPAEQATRDLQKIGVDHFLYLPDQSLYLYAFYPVFQPDSLKTRFRIEKKLDHGYLLTWRRKSDPLLDDDFMRLYQSSVRHEQTEPSAQFYGEWLRLRSLGIR